jgi:hypothetical protein
VNLDVVDSLLVLLLPFVLEDDMVGSNRRGEKQYIAWAKGCDVV